MRHALLFSFGALLLAACEDESADAVDPPVRGLKTHLVQAVAETTTRRYPSVLQPASLSTLSFEVAGRLGSVDLSVGQRVNAGELLAALNTEGLEFAVQTAEAALAQAEATAANAAEQAERSATLLERGVATRAQADNDATAAATAAASVVQAQRSLDTARDNLGKATLAAPFDATLNSVEVDSFATVAAGAPIVTLYSNDAFEIGFSVSFEVVNLLTVGKPVTVRLADRPEISLAGVVSELGARADTVSSFPVVARLIETRPEIKAGMAVEVAMDFPVASGGGFPLPLTVLPMKGQIETEDAAREPGRVSVFVFDPETSTVKAREIRVGGVRGNNIIAIGGLEAGERVASAGASFLRDGQKVKLLADGE